MSVILLTSLLLLGHGNTFAQVAKDKDKSGNKQLADESPVELNKFIVTSEKEAGYGANRAVIGSRLAQDIIDMPSSISVVTPELIDDLAATYGGQAIKFATAGAAFNNNTDDGNVLRGFGASVLRNGTRLLWYQRQPMFDVERIEIVKGPSNMLLGGSANATGGAMNFVTKLPTLTFMADSKLTVGTESYMRYEMNASGPIKKSEEFTASYRISIGGESGNPIRPMNDVDDSFVGGALRLDFGKRIRLDINGSYREDNTADYWPEFLDIIKSAPWQPAVLNQYSSRTFGPGLPSQESWETKAYVVDVTLTAVLTHNGTLRLNYTDMSGVDHRRNLRGISVAADNYTLNRQDIHQNLHRQTRAGQAEYLYQTVRDSWRNDFQIGSELRQDYDGTFNNLLAAPGLDTRNPNYNAYTVPGIVNWDTWYFNLSRNTQRAKQGSTWLQDNLTLFREKVVLVGGLRWNDSSNVAENGQPINEPGNLTLPYKLTRTENPILRTHRYGIVFKPVKDISIYYSNAQNATVVAGFDSDGFPFKNSEGTLREFGAKLTKTNGRFSLNATVAVYNMAQTQIRVSKVDTSLPAGIRYYQDAGGDTAKGWEFELSGRLNTGNGYFDLVTSYLDAKTRRISDGGRNVGAPDNTFGLFAKYSWTGTALKGFTLGAGRYDQSLVRTQANNNTIDYPATYNLMARYDFKKRWAVQLTGTNITDELYISSVIAAGLVQVAPAAEYRLSVRYDL